MSIRKKRYNERVKLAVGTFNALGVALIISGAIVYPLVRGANEADISWLVPAVWFVGGIGIQLVAQLIVGLLREES